MQAYHAALLLFCIAALHLANFAASLLFHPLPVGLFCALVTLPLVYCCSTARRSLMLLCAWLYFLYALIGWTAGNNQASYGFSGQHIIRIEGRLIEDSLLTRSNKQLARIELAYCQTKEGFRATCKGTATALIRVDEVLASSSNLVLHGRLDAQTGLFLADQVQVQSLSRLAAIRLAWLRLLQKRLAGVIADKPSRGLAVMLLLGQSGSSDFPLKDLSLACGCSHLLALSGMHLHFFLSLSCAVCTRVFGRFWGRWIGSVPAVLYVLLVGPKPSLIRALLMHLCSLLPINRYTAFQMAFLLQLLLFPASLSSIACLYSYVAYGMLLLSSLLPSCILQQTAMIVAGSSLASLLLTGSCNLSGLVYSAILTPLINIAMALSFLSLVFGTFFGRLVSNVQVLLSWILTHNRGFILQVGVKGYAVYVSVLLTCLVSIGYATMAVQRRRRRHYELDVRIRLPDRNHCSAQIGGTFHDQEIWSELPHLPLGEGEDYSAFAGAAEADRMGDRAGNRSDHQPPARDGSKGDSL